MFFNFNYNIHKLFHTLQNDFQYLKQDPTIKIFSEIPLNARQLPPNLQYSLHHLDYQNHLLTKAM